MKSPDFSASSIMLLTAQSKAIDGRGMNSSTRPASRGPSPSERSIPWWEWNVQLHGPHLNICALLSRFSFQSVLHLCGPRWSPGRPRDTWATQGAARFQGSTSRWHCLRRPLWWWLEQTPLTAPWICIAGLALDQKGSSARLRGADCVAPL